MNLPRVYEYRFKDVDQSARAAVWREIARDLDLRMGRPQTVLDPAAGRCELINSLPAPERWAVDSMDTSEYRAQEVRGILADAVSVELPAEHFDGVVVSNFLEHLSSPAEVGAFLERMWAAAAFGGRIGIMGPNFRYCSREYFDCSDHVLALTHVAVAEHLYAAGFEPTAVVPRYVPYSFRSRMPASATLARLYLKVPLAWKLLGKQFLVIGEKRK